MSIKEFKVFGHQPCWHVVKPANRQQTRYVHQLQELQQCGPDIALEQSSLCTRGPFLNFRSTRTVPQALGCENSNINEDLFKFSNLSYESYHMNRPDRS